MLDLEQLTRLRDHLAQAASENSLVSDLGAAKPQRLLKEIQVVLAANEAAKNLATEDFMKLFTSIGLGDDEFECPKTCNGVKCRNIVLERN